MSIGNRIRSIRRARGISQVQLSQRTGISQSSISDIERQTNNPSALTLQLIAKALRCTVADLIDEDEKEMPAVSDSGLDEEIVTLLSDLSPGEVQRVQDFVAGLKASRKG